MIKRRRNELVKNNPQKTTKKGGKNLIKLSFFFFFKLNRAYKRLKWLISLHIFMESYSDSDNVTPDSYHLCFTSTETIRLIRNETGGGGGLEVGEEVDYIPIATPSPPE